MKHVRRRLTYANVMSSIAVFLVVAGGSAYAASHLGRNSVGTKQLKKGAVTLAKIAKPAQQSLASSPGPQGPKGEKGDPGPLVEGVPVAGANVAVNGRVQRFFNRVGGGAPSVSHPSAGVYTLEFPGLVGDLSSDKSLVIASLNGGKIGEIATASVNGNLEVHTFNFTEGGPDDRAFEVVVLLPDS